MFEKLPALPERDPEIEAEEAEATAAPPRRSDCATTVEWIQRLEAHRRAHPEYLPPPDPAPAPDAPKWAERIRVILSDDDESREFLDGIAEVFGWELEVRNPPRARDPEPE